MSRHRNIRNLSADDYEDDFGDDDDFGGYGGAHGNPGFSDADLRRSVSQLRAIVGNAVPAHELEETLMYYSLDVPKSVTWLLDGVDPDAGAAPVSVPATATRPKAAQASSKTFGSAAGKQPAASAAAAAKSTSQASPNKGGKQAAKANASANGASKKGSAKAPAATAAAPRSTDSEMDMIAASISELGLGKLAAEQAAAPAPVVVSKKKIDIVAEYAKRPAHLNLVICGHVDAGKSTLTGHLLLQTGAVDKKTVDTYARDAARSGKGSFALAWVLDQGAEERARGVTIDVGVHHFTTPSGSRVYTVLDAPGHRDFIPNMISGAAQADVAVLVVDATEGEFEAGLHGGGQAREHLLLVKSLGIPRLVIAVNKMDVVAWRQDRFAVIVAELEIFLRSIGYDPETQVAFVPTSGLAGTNLTTRVSETESAWAARGKSLIEVLDTLPIPTRPVAKPLRIPVTDYAKGGSASGSVTVWGRIEAGGVQVGDVVRVMPLGEDATVRAVDIDGQDDQQRWAATGDHVALSLAGLDPQQLSAGLVICDRARPVLVTNRVEAKLVVFDLKVPITLGFPMILHQGSVNEPASITQLIAVLDKRDGKITKKNPRVLTKGMTALVEISTERPVCLEPFTESREFGRFMLRKGGETLAAGIVSKVVSLYQPAAMRAESRSSSAWSLNE